MKFSIVQKEPKSNQLFIIDDIAALQQVSPLSKEEQAFAKTAADNGQNLVTINQYNRFIFLYIPETTKTASARPSASKYAA